MSKSIKLKNNTYFDSESIIHKYNTQKSRRTLKDILGDDIYFSNSSTFNIPRSSGNLLLLWVVPSGINYTPSLAIIHNVDSTPTYTILGGEMITGITHNDNQIIISVKNPFGRYGYIKLR